MFQVPDDVYEAFAKLCERCRLDNEARPSLPFLSLFKEPRLRWNVVLAVLLYTSTYLILDSHARNISNLDVSIYVCFALGSALELPSGLLSPVLLEYMGRRWASAISVALSGIFLLPCAWIQGRLSKLKKPTTIAGY